jgi:hypothetical protein
MKTHGQLSFYQKRAHDTLDASLAGRPAAI